MSDDILYSRRQMTNNMNLQLDKAEIYSLTLTGNTKFLSCTLEKQWYSCLLVFVIFFFLEIEKLLNDVRKSLRDFSTLPYLDERYTCDLDNRLINDELSYNRAYM